MENPATWKTAEAVIVEAHAEWHEMTEAGAYGPSVGRHIASKLREAGLINDAGEPELGWTGLHQRFSKQVEEKVAALPFVMPCQRCGQAVQRGEPLCHLCLMASA